MIPRLKPYLGMDEFLSLFRRVPNMVEKFENEFARTTGAQFAIAYPYGRSALWAFFKALGLENAEVIQPAYTCVVVSHATVLSRNIPRFVDISLNDYNVKLDEVAAAINEKTWAVIATHLFGYPLDVDQLMEIVWSAEERFGHKIWLIQDCAHSFGAEWKGRLVSQCGDVSLYGLNISKMVTSVFGGMLTTDNAELASELRTWRDEHFHRAGLTKSVARSLYLLAVYLAFNNTLYGMVNWLQRETPLLDSFTKAYHLDEIVHLPPDYLDKMLEFEARVGLAQLHKYAYILRIRRENAKFYDTHLKGVPGLELPPIIDGATYSHYAIRVKDRQRIMLEMARRGIEIGQLIEYSIPHMASYKEYALGGEFPNSLLCSRNMINLPVYPGLRAVDLQRIVDVLTETMHMLDGKE